MDLSDDDLEQIAAIDRRAADPGENRYMVESWPARVWVKERQEWSTRVRGADGRQRWIRAIDLGAANGSQP